MSDLWKKCQGQLVDNQFPLLQFIASTNHSAVFLTNLPGPDPRKAAIKFISAEIPAPDQQLSLWSRAAELAHPHLLRIHHSGRCRLANMDLLFAVMEHADEDLSQFLPQRALAPQEAREMLNPLVDALVYLHGRGLAHSHVKPSNLLAIADQLKLSTDAIFPIGDSRESHRDLDVYDSPELSASPTITATPAADVWSLGITVVEALTQHAPPLPHDVPFDAATDPAFPMNLPQPFLDIARHSLLRDPALRWNISEIAAALNPASHPVPLAAAAVAASSLAPSLASPARLAAFSPVPASPLRVPLSTELAVPRAKLPVTPPPHNRAIESSAESTLLLSNYVIPVLLGLVLLLGVIFTLPKIFRHISQPAVSTASSTVPSTPVPSNNVPSAAPPVATTPIKSPTPKATTNSVAENSSKSQIEPAPASTPEEVRSTESTPSSVAINATASAPPAVARLSIARPDQGEVLEQVLPQASSKSLSTIHGTVRVVVRVQADAAGNVSSADLHSPGPSKYFADLALRAAQSWQFASPVSEGHSQPSQWLIRFEFSPTGVTAFPTQTVP